MWFILDSLVYWSQEPNKELNLSSKSYNYYTVLEGPVGHGRPWRTARAITIHAESTTGSVMETPAWRKDRSPQRPTKGEHRTFADFSDPDPGRDGSWRGITIMTWPLWTGLID